MVLSPVLSVESAYDMLTGDGGAVVFAADSALKVTNLFPAISATWHNHMRQRDSDPYSKFAIAVDLVPKGWIS